MSLINSAWKVPLCRNLDCYTDRLNSGQVGGFHHLLISIAVSYIITGAGIHLIFNKFSPLSVCISWAYLVGIAQK